MIWLREMKHEDKSQFVQFLNDERVIKFLSSRIPFPYTETDAEWWVTRGSKDDGIVSAIECDGYFIIAS